MLLAATRYPSHTTSAASRVLPGENLSGNLVECLTRLLYRIADAGSRPEAALHLCRRVIGQFAGGRAGRGRLARLDRR